MHVVEAYSLPVLHSHENVRHPQARDFVGAAGRWNE